MNKIAKRILISLFAAIFIFYGSYQFYLVKFASYATDTVIKTTVYDTLQTTGVFIRDEEVYEAPNGVVVQSVDDGGKVSKGGEIAKLFSTDEDAKQYVKKKELEEKLAYYEGLKATTMGEAADIKSLDASILDNINSFVRSKNNPNLAYVHDSEQQINDGLIRRELLTGKEIDFDPIITELKNDINAIGNVNPKSKINTDLAGNFYSSTDGYEIDSGNENITNLTVPQVDKLIESTKEKKQTDSFGKVIKSFNWYVVCNVDTAKIGDLKIGSSKVTVCVDSDDIKVDGTVVGINIDKSSKKSTLIIECSEMNEKISNLRNEKISIRTKPYTGYRVDKRGIHTVDGKKGVYVLIGPVVKFREIKIIYDTGDYVICSMSNEDVPNNVELYDPVIVEGRDLFDGKYIR